MNNEPTPHKKIKNKNYRQFLDTGIIQLIDQPTIIEALKNVTGINGKHIKEGRSLLIALYLTGARPSELLQTQSKDIQKEKNYITYKIPAKKRGLPRTIYLQYKNPLAKELYLYSKALFEEQYLFYHYQNHYKRSKATKKGIITHIETSDKIRYYIKKWFNNVIPDSITPYFLRHNRFSKLSEQGATDQQLKQLKGSKTYTSIEAYRHLSQKSAKGTAKLIK